MVTSLELFGFSKLKAIRKSAIVMLTKPCTEDCKEKVIVKLLKDEDAEVLHYAFNKAPLICEKNPDLQDAIVNQLVENIWIYPYSEAKARISLADVLILNEETVPPFYDRVQKLPDFKMKFDMLSFLRYTARNNDTKFEEFYKSCLFEVFQIYQHKKMMLEVLQSLDPTFDFYEFFKHLLEKYKNKVVCKVDLIDYIKLEKTTNHTEKIITLIKEVLDVGGDGFHWIMNELLRNFNRTVIEEGFIHVVA